jgi:hypothetical protein
MATRRYSIGRHMVNLICSVAHEDGYINMRWVSTFFGGSLLLTRARQDRAEMTRSAASWCPSAAMLHECPEGSGPEYRPLRS